MSIEDASRCVEGSIELYIELYIEDVEARTQVRGCKDRHQPSRCRSHVRVLSSRLVSVLTSGGDAS